MKKGFTLAEILITLAIIGVVSTLTMPTFMNNYQRKVYVAQLQRTYNLISNAAGRLMVDEKVDNLADTILAEDSYSDFLTKYFRVVKNCGTENHSECLGEEYFSLDKSSTITPEEMVDSSYYCVGLNTSATVCMHRMTESNGFKYSDVIVDVNGKNSPNTNGRDLFQFELYSDGKISNSYYPNQDKNSGQRCRDAASSAWYGGSCFQHVMASDWSMDY